MSGRLVFFGPYWKLRKRIQLNAESHIACQLVEKLAVYESGKGTNAYYQGLAHQRYLTFRFLAAGF